MIKAKPSTLCVHQNGRTERKKEGGLPVSFSLKPSLGASLVGDSQIMFARTTQYDGGARFRSSVLQGEITNPTLPRSFAIWIHREPTLRIYFRGRGRAGGICARLWRRTVTVVYANHRMIWFLLAVRGSRCLRHAAGDVGNPANLRRKMHQVK